LIAVNGAPPVNGNAAAALAFATAVFEIILATDATCSTIIPAIAIPLFFSPTCCNNCPN